VCHQTFFHKESLIKTLSFFFKERTCAKKETERAWQQQRGEKRGKTPKERKSPDFYFFMR